MVLGPISCAICGKSFIPPSARSKYCSPECAEKGKRARRLAWELSSGYRERKRLHEQEKRDRKKAEIEAERAAAAEELARDHQNREEKEKQDRINALRQSADDGNPFARMTLETLEHGNLSAVYWQAYRKYDQDFAESVGKISRTTINGICVDELNFPELVVESILRTGKAFVRVSHEKKYQKPSASGPN